MAGIRNAIRLAIGLAALAGFVWLLSAVIPAPGVVLEAEARTIETTALFWTEIEGFEALQGGLAR